MTYMKAVLVMLLLLGSSLGIAKSPPVGQRKYLVDKENLFSPVIILPISEASHQEYLRDPIVGERGGAKVKVTSDVGRSTSSFAKVDSNLKTGRLTFQPMRIEGRLIRPRVNFTHDTIPIKKWDEPLGQRNIDDIFDTAQRLDIDL